jgi:DNA adenine methylase
VSTDLRAPFPWFGGKSRVADVVWERFGDVRNYVEPFFGSGAVLLGRACGARGTETVNDLDGFVANFWRAVALDPAAVWRWADSPVNEADLHARHVWLIQQMDDGFTDRLMGDPDFHDAKIAGWWVWGICAWIGSGWCSGDGPWWPDADGKLANGNAGRGVNRKMPHLGDAGRGGPMADLAERMRHVRVACGDWGRVLGDSVTSRHGTTAVFLDPPYSDEAGHQISYRTTSGTGTVAHDVREWALANGDNPLLRIALCGYTGEGHDVLTDHGWTAHGWKAKGGYGSQGDGAGRANAARETVWFSPHCLDPKAGRLFT